MVPPEVTKSQLHRERNSRKRWRAGNGWKTLGNVSLGRIRPGLSNTWGISYRSDEKESVRGARECVPNEGRHILTALPSPPSPHGNWIKPMELSATDFAYASPRQRFPPIPFVPRNTRVFLFLFRRKKRVLDCRFFQTRDRPLSTMLSGYIFSSLFVPLDARNAKSMEKL